MKTMLQKVSTKIWPTRAQTHAIHTMRTTHTPRLFQGGRRAKVVGMLGVLMAGVASAGDRLPVVSVLFSPDNARVMATVAGRQDGSGFAQTRLVVLDTASGRVVRQADLASPNDNATPAEILNELLRREKQLLSDSGFQPKRTSTLRYRKVFSSVNPEWNEAVRAGESRVYNIKLWSRPVPIRLSVQRSNASCNGATAGMLPTGESSASFVLNVNGQDIVPSSPLPECAARYVLERVDLSGNRAIFTVRAYHPGFEGPNAKAIFVAAYLR